MEDGLKISVITATFNCASTLPDCLASVAGQSYSAREHVIVDGASSDGTIDIIRECVEGSYVFISEPDQGIYDALNKGIQYSTGDVIGFLHSDDLYSSVDVLSMVAEAFSDPSVCAVYGDLEFVRRREITKVVRRWHSGRFKEKNLRWGWMPPHPTLYVRRDFYFEIGLFDTSYRIAADYLSILRLFARSDFRAVYIPNVLVTMRIGGASNKSPMALIIKVLEDWRALRVCGFSVFGAFRAIAWKNFSKLTQFTHSST